MSRVMQTARLYGEPNACARISGVLNRARTRLSDIGFRAGSNRAIQVALFDLSAQLKRAVPLPIAAEKPRAQARAAG